MLRLALALIVAFVSFAAAQQPEKTSVELNGTIDGRGLRTAAVRSVETHGREARVYNLVLSDSVFFVANGFLARSEPSASAMPTT